MKHPAFKVRSGFGSVRPLRAPTALLGAVLLAGCAAGGGIPGLGGGNSGGNSSASTPIATTLPELATADGAGAPTAVIETSYSIDGAILPVVRGTSRQGIRPDMRRNDSLITFDNWMLRQVAGDGRQADIVRVDRKLVWTMQPAKQSYTECPLTGCATPSGKPTAEEKPTAEQSKAREPDCPVTLKTNDLKVSSNGERKSINGFNTERFQVGWTVDLEDKSGRHNINKLVLDMWTTPETGAVKDVQAINDAYQRRYASAITSGDNPFGKYLPREVMTAMSALMKNANTRDAKTLAAWGNEMKKIHGYPISMLATWNSEGSVCGDSASAQSPAAAMPTLGALLGGITGKPATSPSAGSAPLVSYTFEVKSLGVKTISDSNFVPPPRYERSNP